MRPVRQVVSRGALSGCAVAVGILVGGCTGDGPVTPLLDTEQALLRFYDQTGGDSWTNSRNWGTSAPLATWFGVTTDSRGNVVGLDLSNNGVKWQDSRQLRARA